MAAKRQKNKSKYNKRRKRPSGENAGVLLLAALVVIIAVAGGYIYIGKYSPTTEKLKLNDYYTYINEDDAALIVNDTYVEPDETAGFGSAIITGDGLYISRLALKSAIDDGFVFDDGESLMRYTTDANVVTVPYGTASYRIDRSTNSVDYDIIINKYNTNYISAEFLKLFSDFSYKVYEEPYRAVIYTAGFKRNVSKIRGSRVAIRKLGGPKSKILKECEDNEKVDIIKKYGKWTKVATGDGVIGYTKGARLTESEEKTVKTKLAKRNYTHKKSGEKVVLGWHQVTLSAANAKVDEVIDSTKGMNVISPTWYYLNDNFGGIMNLSSSEYVTKAHARDVMVWGLISNLENSAVDTTTVLNTTSSRDALIGNIIGAAIAVDLDGINVDFEMLSADAADGYIEFIRELSLKCKKNDLFLSVDNYVPASYNKFYNRSEQAKYADYVIIMGYDEHHSTDTEAGSVASLPFVKEGVKNTLEEVPAEQIILGMPYYTRVWCQKGDKLTNETLSMKDEDAYFKEHSLDLAWNEELGQSYAEYSKEDSTYMVWVEDAQSLGMKLGVMNENKLAGCAFWKLGFEPETIWEVVSGYL